MPMTDKEFAEFNAGFDIVDLIRSSGIALKRRGRNYAGTCPFCGDMKEQFTVSREGQFYHCFGCQRGGNPYTFLKGMRKLSQV